MSLTHEERKLALDTLRSSEQHLERLLAGLSEEQWWHTPAPDVWSIAHIAEHVVDMEERTLAVIERVMAEPAAPAEEIQRVRGKEHKLLAAVPDRSKRVAAPPGFEVSGKFASPELALEAFRKLRSRSIAMLDRDALHDHLFLHFVFRYMSCYQWLVMLGVHAERHCLQMEEVAASPGFPSRGNVT